MVVNDQFEDVLKYAVKVGDPNLIDNIFGLILKKF